jgi:hypothetical protein
MYNSSIISGIVAGLGVFVGFVILISLAVLVLQIVAKWKVFKKAGKNGWEAIVPYYSTWVLCEITGVKWWFFLLINAATIVAILGLSCLEPLAGIVSLAASFACHYNLALKFNKDAVGYGIGLTLLPVVFYSILAFGDDTFTDIKLSSYGPISEDKVNTTKNDIASKTKQSNNKNKNKFCKNCGSELDGGKFCSNCGAENTQK